MVNSVCYNLCQEKSSEIVAIKKGNEVTIIYRKSEMIVVTSAMLKVGDEPFVKLIKLCTNMCEAHDEMVRIIGKLILKQENSKYFDCPVFQEHMVDGIPNIELSQSLYNIV